MSVGAGCREVMITFDNVNKRYGEGATAVSAVRDLSFVVPTSDFWALIGPSGSGKSTVLHLTAGLTPPDSGRILIDDVDVGAADSKQAARLRRLTIGYVLQGFNLLPFLTASENVGMPLVLEGETERVVNERAAEALEMVDMGHRRNHRPKEMSGGEQQRVAIARAIVAKPAVLLADEPTGNLDASSGRAVVDLIQDVNERTGLTVLMVTHDPVFAARAGHVLRMVDGVLDQEMELRDEPEVGMRH
jgi:putative ABC transport system ATP-binding protein